MRDIYIYIYLYVYIYIYIYVHVHERYIYIYMYIFFAMLRVGILSTSVTLGIVNSLNRKKIAIGLNISFQNLSN